MITVDWLAVLLGLLFMLSGLMKVHVDAQTEHAVTSLSGLPHPLARFTARFLPWSELTLGLWLLTSIELTIAASTAAALLISFTGLVGAALLRNDRVACRCFGALSTGPVSRTTLVRNALLIAVACLLAVRGTNFPLVLSVPLQVTIAALCCLLTATSAGLVVLTGLKLRRAIVNATEV